MMIREPLKFINHKDLYKQEHQDTEHQPRTLEIT